MMKKILLVDDEEAILLSFRKFLQAENYEVTTATSGEEALSKIAAGQYDLVITDLIMEGVDGIKVLQEAKKLNPELVVFILTGYGDLTSAIDALRLGADDYLLKPCDADELLLRIARALAKQALTRKIKLYEDFLPMCMYCRKIRDDTGSEPGSGKWMRLEEYLHYKTSTKVSHGICPECYLKHKID